MLWVKEVGLNMAIWGPPFIRMSSVVHQEHVVAKYNLRVTVWTNSDIPRGSGPRHEGDY